jgi:hypothetical protein
MPAAAAAALSRGERAPEGGGTVYETAPLNCMAVKFPMVKAGTVNDNLLHRHPA